MNFVCAESRVSDLYEFELRVDSCVLCVEWSQIHSTSLLSAEIGFVSDS